MAFFFGKKEKVEEAVEVDNAQTDYLALDENNIVTKDKRDYQIKFFRLTQYDDVKPILQSMREGTVISLIDFSQMDGDEHELHRAIEKLKKTASAGEGDIVGFHEHWLIAAPKNVSIIKRKRDE